MNNLWLYVATRWQHITVAALCGLSRLLHLIQINCAKMFEQETQLQENKCLINEIYFINKSSTDKNPFPLFHKFHYFLLVLLSALMTWTSLFALSYISRIFPDTLSIDVSYKLRKPSWLTSHRRSASVVNWAAPLLSPSPGHGRGR